MATHDTEVIRSKQASAHAAEGALKALANETRLRIVRMLQSTGKELCVCEMVDALQMPEYQVSRHLVALKKAQLVSARKQSTWAYHSLTDDPTFAPIWSFLENTLVGEPYDSDIELLRRRLTLRAGNYCVVGVVSVDELKHKQSD